MPVEVRIADLDAQTWVAFKTGDKAMADDLIDERNAIRPARPPRPVPVMPGPLDSINHWENP